MSAAAAGRDPLESTRFEAVIGLEVHVQLLTRTKMFCRCEARFGTEANALTCPVCLGLPGSLPCINRRAVESTVRVGLAFGSEIPLLTKFDRKSYFYPDLPKGYQISQKDDPICKGGRVEFFVDGEIRVARLVRIHLEEDAGKNIHVEGRPESWVDLNRAGTPLMEVVSEPDLRTPREAGDYMRMLRQVMLYLGVSDCNMEEGSLRCDCNVSTRLRGASHLETRTEIKNLNSFLNVEKALEHEIARQIRLRETGREAEIVQETRLYDPDRGETRSMRGKEEAHDYRYFPEPDLAPLVFSPEWIDGLRATLPELPLVRLGRFQEDLGLSAYHADQLVRDKEIADYFERCVESYRQPQSVGNWVLNALREELRSRGVGIEDIGVAPERFAELVRAVDDGAVSTQKARDVLRAMADSGRPAAELIREMGVEQISDDSFLRGVVQDVIAAHPGPVEDVRRGKRNSINFLVGQVMRRTKGQANPAMAMSLIDELIGSPPAE
ncbi:MAG: Asp-tRNA(Asn)/Glu-tRNA(Gln) amidotransferase subunit GatB [Planctomycetes bacterium]|nr:Asp-tRNA(Asn)/Glu-tRNA(Gln) amidotransferase subunit GatB [Planctomycetota bacterium]